MEQIINFDCDYAGTTNCTGAYSEIRVLPYANGNILCCKAHYEKEISARKEDGMDVEWLPVWDDLKVYGSV